MSRGESYSKTGFTIKGNPSVIPSIPDADDLELEECCTDLFLLVDNSDATNAKRNDITSWFKYYDKSISAAVFKIQLCVDNAFVSQHTIIDNTYCREFIDFGNETHDGLDYMIIHDIDWTAIRVAFGEGIYRIISEATSILSSTAVLTTCDFEYTVKDYTDLRANTTVYMKSFNSGNFAEWRDNANGETKFTYPDDYSDGKRLSAVFGSDVDDMEEETTLFSNGFAEDTKKILNVKYKLETDLYYQTVREYVQFQVRMADYVEMTNYQNNNPTKHELLKVKASGGYAPEYVKQFSKIGFTIEFMNAHKGNFEKLNC